MSTRPICFSIKPANLLPWLFQEDLNANVILLDFDADRVDEDSLQFRINVVFNPLPVVYKKGRIRRESIYVGSTGAEVRFHAKDGKIGEHTNEETIKTANSITKDRKRKTTVTLRPSVTVESGPTKATTELGEITRKGEDSEMSSVTFESTERKLAVRQMDSQIVWDITMPRGTKVIQDFLSGNYYLFASCSWPDLASGTILVRASNVRYFGPDKQPVGAWKTIFIECLLWKNKFKLDNTDGIETAFQEVKI